MGVDKFLKLVGPEFKFKQFKNENHNSVGGPTYDWALQDIFKIWKANKPFFDSSKELKEYKNKVHSYYKLSFPLADGVLYNTVIHILKDKDEELANVKALIDEFYPTSKSYLISLLASNYINSKNYDQAREIIIKELQENPNSFELYEKLAEVNSGREDMIQFKENLQKAIKLANAQKVRQWRIDEIIDLSEISKEL
ncbi:tetratricopeptide repeat protein [Gillisia marina]|uniref:hydrolase of alpha/beta superfamily protein n=1 Tax=Gillisia marina TaxID=1167637 RepID=UPI000299E3D9|nr:hydrolase of alpha/beta superfamily protein [Gillisia marina]